MIFDATTVEYCPKYIRTTSLNDYVALAAFKFCEMLNVKYINLATAKNRTRKALVKADCQLLAAKQISCDLEEIVKETFVKNKKEKLLGGFLQTVTYKGVGYIVPIHAIMESSIVYIDGRSVRGVLIFDSYMPQWATEEDIRRSFLFNITLYALREQGVHIDFVEYIYQRESRRRGSANIYEKQGEFFKLQRVVVGEPRISYRILDYYNNKCRMQLPELYSCAKCYYKRTCWDAKED